MFRFSLIVAGAGISVAWLLSGWLFSDPLQGDLVEPAMVYPPEFPQPDSSEVIDVSDTIQLDQAGRIYDYGGVTLRWVGEGNCDQTEGQKPMFNITARDVRLMDVWIVGAPDGIHIHSSGVTLAGVHFPEVCEDAVTFKPGAENSLVVRCWFQGGEDKAISAQNGVGHVLDSCWFMRCKTALRSKAGVYMMVRDCEFWDCNRTLRADGEGSMTDFLSSLVRRNGTNFHLYGGAEMSWN